MNTELEAQKARVIKVKSGNVTVKIYTRQRDGAKGKLTFYQVADYATGKRRLQGFNDLNEAKSEAKRLADQVASGKTEAARMDNAATAIYGKAVEMLRPFGVDLLMAAANYAKAVKMLGQDTVLDAVGFYVRHRADQITSKLVKTVVAELIVAKQARQKSVRYIDDLRTRLNRFADSFNTEISTITGPQIQAWFDGLNAAPQTLKNYRTVLFTLFSFAESRGYILKNSNPVADTENIVNHRDNDVEIYTPEKIGKLLNAAPREFLPIIALGAFAGLRTSEIERLEWSSFDFASGLIRVQGKVRSAGRRIVPLLPNLSAWLKPFIAEGKVWTGTPQTLRDRRAETCKKAQVEWVDNGLRHSFISYRLALVQSVGQVALEAGNSAQTVFKHYRELVKPDAANAWFAIMPEAPANIVALPLTARSV